MRLVYRLFLLAALAAIVFYICAFKLIDSDFWWHVKAGELMWKGRGLIRTEPFSYVLAGQPYSALHEWLAQIFFYLTFRAGGVTGAILLRGAFAAVAALCLVAINLGFAAITVPLVAAAFYLHRPSLMVRPQLFTILLMSVWFLLMFWYVRAGERGVEEREALRVRRRNFAIGALAMQLLWVNLHGASAIFGVLLLGALFLQGCVDWYRARGEVQAILLRELYFRLFVLLAACALLLASPNLFKTFTDMYAHRFDRTIPLVREWMPLSRHAYLTDVLPFGLLAAGLTFVGRRQRVLCATVLGVLFLLSLQSYRHCIIFVVACLAVSVFQLPAWRRTARLQDLLLRFPLMSSVASLLLLGLLWWGMLSHDRVTVVRSGDFGFGVGIPVSGAVDFALRERITGTLFNTYNEGGYILYRCGGQCSVFADGRNIDYGYPFLQKLLDAGTNPLRWRELNERYRFTYAIVEYKSVPDYGTLLPYVGFLTDDPSWKLIYLDDEATVYVRDLPQYQELIKKFAYRILTPGALEFTDVLERLPEARWPEAEAELRRAMAESPESIKPRLILGNRYFNRHRLDDAEAVAKEALAATQYRPEVFELLGRISAERQDWSQAGDYLERAVQFSGSGEGPQINYDYLAMIFSKAGQNDKADYYHRKAVAAGQESTVIPEEL